MNQYTSDQKDAPNVRLWGKTGDQIISRSTQMDMLTALVVNSMTSNTLQEYWMERANRANNVQQQEMEMIRMQVEAYKYQKLAQLQWDKP